MNDRTSYWFEIAEYDLETARAMLETGRYLYVGFMCHQAIEKSIKAVIASAGETPPFIHNLSRLAELAGVYASMSGEQQDLLDSLDPLNIQARYPEDREGLSSAMNAERSARLLSQTEELYQWIRRRF